MTAGAAQRLAALDQLPALDLCLSAKDALDRLVKITNEETTLLRAGRVRDAGVLTARKAELAQDYVILARAVQRQMERLRQEAPGAIELLRQSHEMLATQMAENLKVIATARNVTEDVLADVAQAVGRQSRARTYSASGAVETKPEHAARGLAVNRAL